MPAFRGPDGKIVYASDEDSDRFEAGGYERVGEAAAGAAQNRIAPVDNGITGSIGATVSAGLSGATLGASDWLLKGVLNKGQFGQLAQDRADNPILASLAQGAGAILPALVSGGSITPSGYLSKLAAGGIEAGSEAGGAIGAVRQLTAAGAEGAIQNAGVYLSDVALGDRDLTAEGMTGALGTGLAFGSGGLVAMHGIVGGTVAARRMFARYAQGGERAAADAMATWQAQSAKTLEAFDQTATAAETKLQEAQLARQQADLARKQAASGLADARAGALPTEPGVTPAAGAPPVAPPSVPPEVEIAGLLRDRAVAAMSPDKAATWSAENGPRLQELMSARMGQATAPALPPMTRTAVHAFNDLDAQYSQLIKQQPADLADLSSKLAEYQDARRAFSEVHASVDPELEAALTGMRAPETGEAGGAIGQRPVPVGEFGAPGARGYNPGEVAAPGPPSQAPLASTAEGTPVTRALRKGAAGEPTTAFDFKDSGLTFDPATRNYSEGGAAGPAREPAEFLPQITKSTKRPAEIEAPKPTAAPLTDDEFKSLKRDYGHAADAHMSAEMYYSKGGDEIVNPALRSGEPLSGKAKGLHDSLMEAYRLPESRLKRDVEVYRGLSDRSGTAVKDRFADVKPGDTLDDPAFMSTSYYAGGGSRGEEVVFLIHAPAGSPALPIRSQFGNEGELLFPPHSKLRVDSVEKVPVGERWHLKRGQTKAQFAEEHGGMEIRPDGTTVLGSGKRSSSHPPLKEIRATLIDAPAPAAAGSRAPRVDLDAPVDKLSVRQIGEYQDAIDQALKSAPDPSPERDVLGRKWDEAVNRRNAISDGAASPPDKSYVVHGATVPESTGDAARAPQTSKRAAFEPSPSDAPVDKSGTPAQLFERNNATVHINDERDVIDLRLSSINGDGRIHMVRDKDGQFRLSHITVDKGLRGRGLGAAMYLEMGEHLEAKYGQKLMSDYARSDAAEHVWQGFEQRGMARPVLEPGAAQGDRPLYWVLERTKPPASDTLTGLLRGTQDRLSASEPLSAMGEPARAEYRTAKAARTADAAEHFRAKAIAKNYAGSEMAAAERGANAERIPEFPGASSKADDGPALDRFFADLRAPKTRDSYVAQNIGRAMREEGSHAAALAKVEREWVERVTTEAWAERAAVLEHEGGHSRVDAERIARDEVEGASHDRGAESPAAFESKKNLKRTEAAKKAAAASVERLHEIHSAVASNLPQELQTTWNAEGYKFLRQEAPRIRGVKDRINAASKISEAFAEQYGSASETARGYEGDKFHRRAEIEAKHAESWANEQERKHYAAAARDEHPLATKQLEVAHDAASERAASAKTEPERAAAATEAKAIERQLTQVGARPGAVEDVAAMAPAIHRVEKAAADLTEALGESAPAAAVEHAKAFREAEDTTNAKSMARTARAADDHAAAQEKAQAEDFLGPSKKDRAIAGAKQRKLEAEAAYAKARVSEAEASIGAKQAAGAAKGARDSLPPMPGAAPTAQGTGIGHRVAAGAHAIGYAAELGSDLGIPGIPRPHDIPVIGPLLSAYLKYRAFRAAAGRFTGRIPATAEARAAELAARTRDGVARAVDRSLGLIERSGPTIRRVATVGAIRASEALSRRAFDDGEPDAPAGASVQQQAAVRMREIAAVAANPQLITDMVRKQTRDLVDPDLITALENHLVSMFQHLSDTAPKGPPPNPYSKKEWLPSPAAAMQFGQRLAVANNPQVAFELLEHGALTPPAADTFRAVYDKLFAEAQKRIVERAADIKHPVEYRQLIQNSLLFDAQLHESLDPENATILATAHAPAPPTNVPQPSAPPMSSVAAPTAISKLYASGTDRSGRI